MSAPPKEPATALAADSSRRTEACDLAQWSDGTLIGLLIPLAALPYVNTLFNAFVYDDNTQVLNNPYIQSFRYWREIFSTTVWSYIGAQTGTNYYRPLMTLGYLICYQLFGPMAYGFHLASVILHTIAVCVLFLVAQRIFDDRRVAFVSAGLFALHPVHAESVAWIAAVTDLEVTAFYLFTFWFFLGVARQGGGRSTPAVLGMVGCYFLTILSKEQALTFPFLATVYEHAYRDDRAETTWKQKVARYGVLWLMDAAYILFRIEFLGGFVPVLQKPRLGWTESFLSAIALAWAYVAKLVWPVHLLAFYVFRKSTSLFDLRVLAGLGVLALGAIVFSTLWRRARPASFGLVLFVLTLVPVLNARWLAANVFAERYLYLPSAGFLMTVAWGWVFLWKLAATRRLVWRPALAVGLGVVSGLFAVRIVTRNRDWRTDSVLYARTLAVEPGSWVIHNNLGGTYWMQGDVQAAGLEWRRALEINPASAIILSNLGLVAAKEKQNVEAVDYFRRSLRADPRFTDAHVRLGETYLAMGSKDLAELQFKAAVALSPLNTRARNHLGQIDLDLGRVREAEDQFLRSIESEPNVTAYEALGSICVGRGDQAAAARAFARALSLDAFDSVAHFKLAELYAQAGRNADAMREYQAGLLTDPANSQALAAVRKLQSEVPHAQP
jgi:tetratricopeptide (TPR) repeat protein